MSILTPILHRVKRHIAQIALLVGLFLSPGALWAQNFDSGFDNSDDFLPVEQAYQVMPEIGDSTITLYWSIADGYYLYQDRFKLQVRNDSAAHDIELSFEQGEVKYDEYFDKELVVYHLNTQVRGSLPDIQAPYELLLQSMGCADAGLCYPPRKQYFRVDSDGAISETAAASFSGPAPATADASRGEAATAAAEQTGHDLLLYLVFALVGGAILNLMPCVFPVLSLKALSFASSQAAPRQQHSHGWAYTAGVVLSFFAVGLIILGGRQLAAQLGWVGDDAGRIGWGAQMQIPLFIIAMIYLFFLMGLSLAGMFQVGTRWMGVGQELTAGHGLRASFFTGVLAALVASPCTGPLMAPALGAALLLPFVQGMLIFVVLGLGMALPFLLLSYNPKLAQKLPAPGPWMETLKQFLAFPMFITCIWLLWVLGHQTSSDGAAMVILGALLLTFAIWLHNLRKTAGLRQQMVNLLLLLSVAGALAAGWSGSKLKFAAAGEGPQASETWLAYTPEALASLRADSVPVFVDLTADWCLTCKFNERVALTDKVEQFAQDNDIALMVGDWTNSNPDISALLEKYQRSGVPLYLMYPADAGADAQILPQILSESTVLQAMERALAP